MGELTYPVVEIFDSVQGEGILIGRACTFIRFAGCNLACEWCDTDFSKYQDMSINQIVNRCKDSLMIVFTGGEPTLYDLKPLTLALRYKTLCIETNGTNAIKGLFHHVSVSPKPQSNYYIHSQCRPHELKYVVTSDFHARVIPKEFRDIIPIWLQPLWQEHKQSIEHIKEIQKEYPMFRMSIQAHKFWGVA
jgi:organic radical activating enzyme